jgi:hypothetical protein
MQTTYAGEAPPLAGLFDSNAKQFARNIVKILFLLPLTPLKSLCFSGNEQYL